MGMALVIREIRRVVKDVIHTALSKKGVLWISLRVRCYVVFHIFFHGRTICCIYMVNSCGCNLLMFQVSILGFIGDFFWSLENVSLEKKGTENPVARRQKFPQSIQVCAIPSFVHLSIPTVARVPYGPPSHARQTLPHLAEIYDFFPPSACQIYEDVVQTRKKPAQKACVVAFPAFILRFCLFPLVFFFLHYQGLS